MAGEYVCVRLIDDPRNVRVGKLGAERAEHGHGLYHIAQRAWLDQANALRVDLFKRRPVSSMHEPVNHGGSLLHISLRGLGLQHSFDRTQVVLGVHADSLDHRFAYSDAHAVFEEAELFQSFYLFQWRRC